ncbi:hypothetical protein G9A89_007503 [Geosiphon pyriformis]|nr:hypothetical protein G9A89_007503 [Geosiphon pyriformis]
MIRKELRAKVFLPKNFSIETLYHLSLYGLKLFEQVQAEAKVALVINFSNAPGILSCLFEHYTLDLQVLGWALLNLLYHPVKLRVCPLNNFLAGVVRIFLNMGVFLVDKLLSAFCKPGHFSMSEILSALCYFNMVYLLKRFGIAFGDCLLTKWVQVMDWKTFCCWKRLSPKGPVPVWFSRASVHMCGSLVDLNNDEVLDGKLNIFTDGSLNGLDILGVACGAAVYFSEIDLGIGVRVQGLLFSMLAELQVIAVALKCVPLSCFVVIHSDS